MSPCRTLLDRSGSPSPEDEHLHFAKLMLEFLALIWQSGTRGFLHTKTVSELFSSIVDQLAQEFPTSTHGVTLLATFLTTLAVVETLRSTATLGDVNKVWQDDTLWQLSFRVGCSDLVGAGKSRQASPCHAYRRVTRTAAFASFMLAACRVCNPLRCAQAWSHLRDVFLLILTRQFLGDDESLASLICPIICRALLFLLKRSEPPTSTRLVSSPLISLLHSSP
jgi:hypothetical protein